MTTAVSHVSSTGRDADAVAPQVQRAERAHHRIVITSVVLLIVIEAVAVFGHDVTTPAAAWLAGRGHVLSLCLVALADMMAPVHRLFHLMLMAGIVYALADRVLALARLSETLSLIDAETVSPRDPIGRAALAAGVECQYVRRFPDCGTPAFTAGMLRPRIYVSTALASRLSHDELTAIIAHEDAHRRRRDPLRLTAGRFVAKTLFFVPVLSHLIEDLADDAEIAADDAAVTATRVQPLILASALLTITRTFRPGLPVPSTAGIMGQDLLERRVRRLAGEHPRVHSHVSARSLLVAAVVLSTAWASVLLVPSPASSAVVNAATPEHGHCQHHRELALRHLLCKGRAAGACPHAAQHVRSSTLG